MFRALLINQFWGRLALYGFLAVILAAFGIFLGHAQVSVIENRVEQEAAQNTYAAQTRVFEATRIAQTQAEEAREQLRKQELAEASKPTPTPTPSPTPTPTPTPTATPTPKPSPRATPTPTPSANPNSGGTSASTTWSKYYTNIFTTDRGTFSGSVMQFELGPGKVKVITDTAADTECLDNCPVKPVADYVTRFNGIAGVNGTYFCPSDYSSCNGQLNSFIYKIFNPRLGRAINRENGSWEQMPLIAFDAVGNWRYFDHWYDIAGSSFPFYSGINHSPRLIVSGAISITEGELDSKQKTKATRAAFGLKGMTLYVVHISNATILDLASVMKALNTDYALNLDAGGSSAFYYNGKYRLGPGRQVPNAMIFVEQ